MFERSYSECCLQATDDSENSEIPDTCKYGIWAYKNKGVSRSSVQVKAYTNVSLDIQLLIIVLLFKPFPGTVRSSSGYQFSKGKTLCFKSGCKNLGQVGSPQQFASSDCQNKRSEPGHPCSGPNNRTNDCFLAPWHII